MRRILLSEKNEFSSDRRQSVSLSVAVRWLAEFYSKVDESDRKEKDEVVISTTVRPNSSLQARRP